MPTKNTVSPARAHLVEQVMTTLAHKRFSNHALDYYLQRAQLTAQDAALFTELYYGLMRFGHQLLYLADTFLKEPANLPAQIKWLLALAFYQKLYLEKIPDFAIVNESVNLARTATKNPAIIRLVNAVLRKFMANPEECRKNQPLWVRYSLPEWLARRWLEMWGDEKAEKIMQALLVRSPTYIRINTRLTRDDEALKGLLKMGIDVENTSVPHCFKLAGATGGVAQLPGYKSAHFFVQNISSQKIVPLLDIAPNQEILDCCAGYGGKALHCAEIIGDHGMLFIHDKDEKKMTATMERAKAGGFNCHRLSSHEKKFDRILVDAPCSGLGSIGSHPEIKWYRGVADMQKYATVQLEILEKFSKYLKTGGKILYVVCSIDHEEADGVVEKFLHNNPEFACDQSLVVEGVRGVRGFYILPDENGATGYYVARLISRNDSHA